MEHKLLGNKINEIRQSSKSFLSFKIGKELFAAHVAHVNNIIEVPRITEIPETPEFMKGVINLRGSVLPVIDTCIKFNHPPIEFTTTTCILVLDINYDGNTIPVGALVDNVNEVLEIEQEQILPPPELNGLESANDFIEGMVNQDEQFIMLLNIDKLFDSESLGAFKSHAKVIAEEVS